MDTHSTNEEAQRLKRQAFDIIRDQMKCNDISQAEMARRMGRTSSAVSRMLKDQTSPTLRTLAAYSRAVGIRLEIREAP